MNHWNQRSKPQQFKKNSCRSLGIDRDWNVDATDLSEVPIFKFSQRKPAVAKRKQESKILNETIEAQPEFLSVDARNIKLQSLISLITSAVLAVGWLVGVLGTYVSIGLGWVFYSVVGVGFALVVLLFWFSFYWPRLSHRKTSYRLDETGLLIQRGVFFQHRISVPTARVQHADVSQGPLQRQFDLGTLTVHTAGTSNASVELDGLQHGIALALRDQIVRQRKAIDVV